MRDTVEVKRFDSRTGDLDLQFRGEDRPGVISLVTGKLDSLGLYVASITFNLVLPSQDQYAMEILAKGDQARLSDVVFLVEAKEFLTSVAEEQKLISIPWQTAYQFHLSLATPDRPGLTAKVADIVGKPRKTTSPGVCPSGSFVHLVGITHNSAGPEGGTPYFSLRANVATQALDVQDQIMQHLQEWARKNQIEDHLGMQDLNNPRLRHSI